MSLSVGVRPRKEKKKKKSARFVAEGRGRAERHFGTVRPFRGKGKKRETLSAS